MLGIASGAPGLSGLRLALPHVPPPSAMNSTPGWAFAIEVHPEGWRFPAEKAWVAGWILPAAGQPITDVRARLHHRVILGLFGLPHPAHPAAPGSGPGFSFLFTPQRGATLLRLEARSNGGSWTEFFRTSISADPAAPAHAPAPALAPALARLISALLKHRLREPASAWSTLAHESLEAFIAEPLNAHPNPPCRGALEEPTRMGRLRYGRIPVTGWLAHPTSRLRGLFATIEPQQRFQLTHGLARADLEQLVPPNPQLANGAFVGELPLPPHLATPVLLKVEAELDDGSLHLVFAQRFTPHRYGDTGAMPPLVKRRAYVCACWALFRAAGRLALSRAGFLEAAWAAFQTPPAYRPTNRRLLQNVSPAWVDNTPPHTEPVCSVIADTDEMCMVDADQYFRVGREALRLVQQAVRLGGGGPVHAILDLPSGHGRVARWFRTVYPDARLTVSDTSAAGVAFCMEALQATGVVASVEGGHWEQLTGPYDVIWCGSLLTHFDESQWSVHLQRFAERLSPQGVLVFTSHGLPALELLHNGEKDYGLPPEAVAHLQTAAVAEGFGYAAYPESPAYGISFAQPGWIDEFITRETRLRLIDYRPAAWDDHQDVVVCQRR